MAFCQAQQEKIDEAGNAGVKKFRVVLIIEAGSAEQAENYAARVSDHLDELNRVFESNGTLLDDLHEEQEQ